RLPNNPASLVAPARRAATPPSAHDIPTDVKINAFIKPQGKRSVKEKPKPCTRPNRCLRGCARTRTRRRPSRRGASADRGAPGPDRRETRRARGAFGRKEAQRRGDVLAEPVDTHADGELGTVGVDRVFEQDIEQLRPASPAGLPPKR